jgi:peptidoglycan hydrolase CwlO-like protein
LLDGVRQLTRKLADSANNRLQAAQEQIPRAQNLLASTQKRLTDAQAYIEKCHSKFDVAIERLRQLNSCKEDLPNITFNPN